MSEDKVPFIIRVCYGDKCSKKRVKVPRTTDFQLVGVFGVGVMAGESIKVFLPLADISMDDLRELSKKYGIKIGSISAMITEIKEEKKGERELRFEDER